MFLSLSWWFILILYLYVLAPITPSTSLLFACSLHCSPFMADPNHTSNLDPDLLILVDLYISIVGWWWMGS